MSDDFTTEDDLQDYNNEDTVEEDSGEAEEGGF